MTPTTFHIEARGEGRPRRWRAVVYVGKREGGPRRLCGKWRHHEYEAKADGQTLLESLSGPDATTETVAALLTRWLRDYAAGAVEDTTLAHYRRHAEDHIIPALGTIRVAELTTADVARWQAEQLATQAPKSVRNYRGVLGGALSWAVKLGELPANVVAAVPAPKWKRAAVEPPTMALVQSHLAALEGTRYRLPFLIAAGMGMRRGEVLGLEWRNLDLQTGILKVRQNVRQVGSEVSVVPYLKTAAGRRDLPLPAFVAAALRSELRLAQLHGGGRPHDRICGPVKPDQLTKGLRQLLTGRGLAPVRMHALRHALASTMLASGVSMLEVAAFLGHKDVTTTLGVYGHLLPGALKGAADRYGRAWEKAALSVSASSEHQNYIKEGAKVVSLASKRR